MSVDVLILPIETVLTRAEVDAIERKYDPKAIIPAHYFLKGLTTEIQNFDPARMRTLRSGDQHVIRLQITVRKAGSVGRRHAVRHRLRDGHPRSRAQD